MLEHKQNIMKLTIPCLAALFAAAAFLSSCSKESMQPYSGGAGIYITGNTHNDSTRYSFAVKNSSRVKDTIWVNVRITGAAAEKDRAVLFTAVDSLTTAQKGTHYELLPHTIPAGAFTGKLGIVVFRTPDLLQKTVKLGMRLSTTPHFTASIKTDLDYTILLNDILTKPDNWDRPLVFFLGAYSQVKHRFMIDVLGIAEYPTDPKVPGSFTVAELLFFQGKMQNALAAYNATHPVPMQDENGNPVIF